MENTGRQSSSSQSLLGRPAIRDRIAIDRRGLAALRIALGLLVGIDLLWRSIDLVAFYTDVGVLPSSLLTTVYPTIGRLSIYTLSGDPGVQAGLFAITGVCAIALAIGIRTRLATVLTLVLVISLHARNPVLLNAGDSLLRRLLLWGVFLPLGSYWSIDARRTGRMTGSVSNLATVALLLQVILVYAVNAIVKLRGSVWPRGEALFYVFSLDRLTVGLGDLLAANPTLLSVLDWMWLGLLIASPLLVLLTGRARLGLVGFFAGGHLAMALTLRLGLFPLISIAALLPFLPPMVWDCLERGITTITAAISDRLSDIGSESGSPEVSGRTISATQHRAVSAIVAVLVVSMLLWNGFALGYLPTAEPMPVSPSEYRWDMFAPHPPTSDGWIIAPATLSTGRTVDAFHGGPVSHDRPPDLTTAYPSHRWLVYLTELTRSGNDALRTGFAGYLCRRWNSEHSAEMEEVSLIFYEERTRLDGPEPVTRVNLGQYQCSAVTEG